MSGNQFPSKDINQPGMKTPWVKGQSGNPGGQSKMLKEVRRLCQEICPEAVARLWEIAKCTENLSASVAAIKDILVRGIGKELEHSSLEQLSKNADATHGRIPDVDVKLLSDSQIERIEAILKEQPL